MSAIQYRYAVADRRGDIIESGMTADTPEEALAKAKAFELLEGALEVDGPHLVLMRRHAATEWERDDAERVTAEQVLAEHTPIGGRDGELIECACGHQLIPLGVAGASIDVFAIGDAAFISHLAEQLRAAGVVR